MFIAYYNKFKKFKEFLGKEVWLLFASSILIGFLWFLVESSFIFVLQGFLSSIGLIEFDKTFLPTFYPRNPIGAILCLLAFGLFRAITISLKYYFSEITNQAFVRTQRERILEFALNETSQVSMHETMSIFNEKISTSAGVIQLVTTLINSLVASGLFFLLGMRLAPVELGVGVFLLLVLFLPLKVINKLITDLGNRHGQETTTISQILVLGLRNHFLLKVYNLTKGEVEKGKTAAKKYEQLFQKYILMSSLKSSFPQFAGAVVITLMCYVSIVYIKTPGMKLLSFIYIFMRLAQGLSESSVTLSNIRFNMSKFKELYRWNQLSRSFLLKNNSQDSSSEHMNISPDFLNYLNFNVSNLHFSYEHSPELFSGLNLTVNSGEVLLLKGPSGCGKSTLLSLLLGLDRPSKGDVLVNNIPVTKVRSNIAPLISYVGPEPFINGGTIRDNLLYANPNKEFSDHELFEVLEKAQLIDIINSGKFGLDRELKEVTELSTGQKQRLSIARALLRRPKLLVLDEATANLDHVTESEIVKMIKNISSQMTVIIISHKDSFDSISDKILDLKQLSRSLGYEKEPV